MSNLNRIPGNAISITVFPILRAFSIVFTRVDSPRLIALLSIMLEKGPMEWKQTDASENFFNILIGTFILRRRLERMKRAGIGEHNHWEWLSLANRKRLSSFFFLRRLPADLHWSIAQFLPTVADTLLSQLKELEKNIWILARERTLPTTINVLEKERETIISQILPALKTAILDTPLNESFYQALENGREEVEKGQRLQEKDSTFEWVMYDCKWVIDFMKKTSAHTLLSEEKIQLPALFKVNEPLLINVRGQVVAVVALKNSEVANSWYPGIPVTGTVTRDLLTETAYQYMAEIGMTQAPPTEDKSNAAIAEIEEAQVVEIKDEQEKTPPSPVKYLSPESADPQTISPISRLKNIYSQIIATVIEYVKNRLAEVPESSSIARHRRRKVAGIGVGPTCEQRIAVAMNFINYLLKKISRAQLIEPVFLHPSVFRGGLAGPANQALPYMTQSSPNRWC